MYFEVLKKRVSEFKNSEEGRHYMCKAMEELGAPKCSGCSARLRKWIWTVLALVSATTFAETCIVSGNTARSATTSGEAQTAVMVGSIAAASASHDLTGAFDSRTGSEAESANWIPLDTRKPGGVMVIFR